MFTLVLSTGIAISFLHFDTEEACEKARAKLAEQSDSAVVGVCIVGGRVDQKWRPLTEHNK
jgi:hypothetical protein